MRRAFTARSPLLPTPAANRVRIIGGAWRGRVDPLSARGGPAADAGPRPRDAVQLARPGPDRQALPRSLCRDRARCRSKRPRAARRSPSRSTRTARWSTRCARPARRSARSAVEAHVGDARAFLASERRDFDVIFLDPPFDDDPWPWLLPALRRAACARRLPLCRSRARARAARRGSSTWRRDKAGQVHYHLFTRAEARRPSRSAPSRPHVGPHAHRRLPRHVRPVHPRPRGPRAPRGEALRPRRSSASPTARRSSPFFTTAERVEMAREVLAPYRQRRGRGVFGAADGFRPRAGRAGRSCAGCAPCPTSNTNSRWRE